MRNDHRSIDFGSSDWSWNGRAIGRNRVLLREPEKCPACEVVFLSLYPIGCCADHAGLDRL